MNRSGNFLPLLFHCLRLLHVLSLLALSSSDTLRPEEYSALEAFYQSLNGPSWLVPISELAWDFSEGAEVEDPCNGWMGVVCNDANTSLRSLSLPNRELFGELDTDAFSQFIALQALNLGNNSIHGDFPVSVLQNENLTSVILKENLFSGSILVDPNSMIGMESVIQLDISNNNFNGDISFVYHMSSLQLLNLANNSFTGGVSSDISNLTNLRLLNTDENPISGNIPTVLGNMNYLEGISMQSCGLSGRIPSQISTTMNLRYLRLENNRLTGGLGGVFSPTQSLLQLVDLGSNKLTGTLPVELFQLPKLRILSLMKNSFSGSIPEALCELSQLQVLSLNGLTSADDYLVPRYMEGGIPDCVFNSTTLTVFQASGNGLTGMIGDISPNSQLLDLRISHNKLMGTVPLSIQKRNFTHLDLAYNKFRGDFHPTGSMHQIDTIHINYNRFSGELDEIFSTYKDAAVLSGNIWKCSTNELPDSDVDSRYYDCNTALYTNSIIAWGAFSLFAFFLGLIYFWAGTRNQSAPISSQHDANDKSFLGFLKLLYQYTFNFSNFAQKAAIKFADWAMALEVYAKDIQQVRGYLTCCQYLMNTSVITSIMLVLMVCPIFTGMKSIGYGTHEEQLTWEVSGAFLSGMAPGGLLFMIWTIAISFMYGQLIRGYYEMGTKDGFDKKRRKYAVAPDMAWKTVIIGSIAIITSLTIVILINAAYVLNQSNANTTGSKSEDANRHASYLLLFFVAMFKATWATMIVPFLIAYLKSKIILGKTYWLRLKILLILFNTIVAPFLASTLIDGSCFQPLIFDSKAISFSYSYATCEPVDNLDVVGCVPVELYSTASFVPPFIYNNICSSILFSYYVPIYLYVYIMYSFCLPIGFIVIATTNSKTFPSWSFLILPGVLWPKDEDPDKFKVLFDPDDLTANQLQHFTTLLTFGIASPALAVAISVTMCVEMFTWRVILGRYVIQSKIHSNRLVQEGRQGKNTEEVKAGELPGQVEKVEGQVGFHDKAYAKLNNDCMGAWRRPLNCSWLTLWISAIFFGMVSMDVSCDKETVLASMWLPIVYVVIPLLIWRYKKAQAKGWKLKNAGNVIRKAIRRVSMRTGLRVDEHYNNSAGKYGGDMKDRDGTDRAGGTVNIENPMLCRHNFEMSESVQEKSIEQSPANNGEATADIDTKRPFSAPQLNAE